MSERDVLQSAHRQAYEHLRQRIRSGQLRSGERVVAEDIAAELALSRMPVREAIRQLATEGLLTLRRNRGAVVTALAPDDIMELFEMRAALEGLAVRKAVMRLDADAEDTLFLILRRMSRATGSVDDFILQHDEFHREVCALGGRAWLVAETERLRGAVEPYLRLYFTQHRHARNSADEHALVLDALVAREPDRAEQVWRHHVLSTAPELLEFLRGAVPA